MTNSRRLIVAPRGPRRGIIAPQTYAGKDAPMSALGQKQTFALHQPMSALPPIVTAKADFPQKSCPLYPRKRTCAAQLAMSAMGHKRYSFDHFIGGGKK